MWRWSLDQVAGPDAEDEATADAAQHIDGSFAAGLDAARSRARASASSGSCFVGVTGEREAAARWSASSRSCSAAGAIVVDVAIPDLDAQYAQPRGSAPGSLKAGWTAYLSRGATAGDKVLTIEDLLASGKLAPVSARRLEDALQPVPAGDELRAATATFYRRPRSVPRAVRRPDGAAAARRAAVSGEPWRGRTRMKAASNVTARSRARARKAR